MDLFQDDAETVQRVAVFHGKRARMFALWKTRDRN